MKPTPDLTVTSLCRTVSALQAEIEALRHDASHDKLTGLGNRRLLEERTSARGGFFVAIDLDGFKRAQDSNPMGHAFGDEVLRRFARLLLAHARVGDRVACRTGGDEFVVWCPNELNALAMIRVIRAWSFGGVSASAGFGSDLVTADLDAVANKRSKR